ncbi:hypothetical protein E6C67_02320 [Azospirillum sp. TSA2s]|uniref:hypothetical protein n=1 Tax=Azospirillum sp. TSA2s TaxID=709810 RepID=UPI0010AA0019|nr:hypothetical protein [Azospirillum sp. TSA2s]QCG92767.1 hypothetical protein E6C67_02320 [Azospirillum sp. TSA2s]
MAFKPNYNQQRAERNRAKEQKKAERLQRREEGVAARRAGDQTDSDQTDPELTGQDDADVQDDAVSTDTDTKTDTNNA